MSRNTIAMYDLAQALKDEGFVLPPECSDIKLLAPVDGVFTLNYVVNLSAADLGKLGRALVRMSER